MALSVLDERIFAIDHQPQLVLTIGGQVIPMGLDANGNTKSVAVDFDIEQIPPTASISFAKEQRTENKSGLPTWVLTGMDVHIDGGYDGELVRIFTGRTKKPRHGVSADTLDCVGRTGKLTRPYRTEPPKVFTAIDARSAIIDILDDYGVDFTPAGGEKYDIDPILMSDGTPWIMATVVDAVMDMAQPSDMIRKIADVYGHRVYELPSGTLRIRELLEVPAPEGFRTYSTDPAVGTGETTGSTLTYSDSNIDAVSLMGDVAANTRRSQAFIAGASGSPTAVSVWARRIGAPVDGVTLSLYRDNGSGVPSTAANALLASGQFDFNGQLLDLVTYAKMTISVPAAAQLVSGDTYHLVIARSGALDAVNHYDIGIDQTAPGYADGAAGVYDGAAWALEDAGGDGADHPFEISSNSFATLRVLDIGDDEDEDQVKKMFIVKGAVFPEVDGEGNEITAQVKVTVQVDTDDLVAGDPELFSMTYLNDLMDTTQVAADAALRLIDKYHRVLKTIEIEVPFDPRMALGTTITIDDPAVTGHGGNWWVHGYRHSLSADAAVTQLSLFGGDQSGTTGELLPQPDFTWQIERELIGNALMSIVTYTSTSQDYDGWITNHSWLDNYAGGANSADGEMTKVTFAYDPSVDPAIDMTLTVTDNDGNTASVTHSIDVTTDNSEVYAPVVACAGGNTCMATFDGGLSWQDIATPSGVAVVTGITYDPSTPQAEMSIMFGTDNGRIYLSTDGMQTLVLVYTDADSDEITAIVPDTERRGLVWATSTDRVPFSADFGATWRIYTDFNSSANWPKHGAGHVNPGPTDPRPINAIEVSDAAVNRIWIFGGVGDVVESWFATNWIPDGGAGWWSELAQGDGSGAVPRDSLDTVVDFVVSHAHSGDLGLIFERTGGGVPANPYLFSSQFYPVGEADWRVGGGAMVTPGVDGVSVAGNNAQVEQFGAFLDNTNFYVANDGRSFWPHTAVLPGTGANRPHHLLNVTAWRDMYLGATDEGIVKSIDGGATWDFFRPVAAPISTTWPGGAIGWEIAIEYRRPRSYNLAAIVGNAVAAENALAVRTTTGGWSDRGPLPTAYANAPHRLWHFPQIGSQVLFYTRYVSSGTGHEESLWRTPDGGATWVEVLAYTYALARGSDGRLWATHDTHGAGHDSGDHHPHVIMFSDDDGLTWQEAFEDTDLSGGLFQNYKDIAVDPNDPNRIMVVGHYLSSNIATLHSTDATDGTTSNWTRQQAGFNFEGIGMNNPSPFILAGDAERWIIGFQPAGVNRLRLYTNDQNGVPAAWTLRYDETTTGPAFGFGDRLRAGNILYAIGARINNGSGILKSVDNGQTWQTVHAQTAAVAGIWDAQSDMLIIGRGDTTDRFPYYQPPTPGAIAYPGIDDGLDTAMGYVATPANTGMALLRSATGTNGSPTELWAIAQVAAAGGDTDIWLREAISDSWSNHLDMPNTLAAENRFPIWHFAGMGDVMFRLKIGDLGSAASGYGGDLERSDDRGLTWATVLANAGSLARGRNGYLWATADDRGAPASFQPRTIYRSRDGGLTWLLMGTDTTAGTGAVMTKYTQIRVDPANSNRIMAVGGLETDTMRSAYSPDGGTTWTYRSGSMGFRDGTAADGVFINLMAGGAGRWIIGLSQADGLAKFIFTSDDYGETWVQKYTVVTTAVTLGWVDSVRAGGGDLYMAGNGGGVANATDERVVVSEDNGDTWAPFTGDDRSDIMALTYDNSKSVLYIGRASAASNVLYMKNPSVLGVWSDDSIPTDPRFILQEGLKVVT